MKSTLFGSALLILLLSVVIAQNNTAPAFDSTTEVGGDMEIDHNGTMTDDDMEDGGDAATPFPMESYTCAAGGSPADQDKCTRYTSEVNNIDCDCFYFCEGGSLVQCLDNGVTKEFNCPGGVDVITCYEKAGEGGEEPSSAASMNDAKEAMESLYYTASVALGAILCFL